MVGTVFTILYLVAVILTTVVLIYAWKDGVDDCPKYVGIMLAIVCGIAWPILAFGICLYLVEYGIPEDEES